jgi:hypothetical protein
MIRLPVVDRYVLKQVATPLLTAMAIGLLVLLAERMVRLLEVTLGKKNSFAVVFELLGYLVPHYLGLALPAAMFLGLLFGFNKMSKDSEIDAFLASGIGLHRLVRPVLGLAVVLALVVVGIFGWLQPHGRYAYRSVMFNVKNVEVFYLAEEGAFMQAGQRTFILDKLSRGSNAFERLFLFEDRGSAGAETITAARGLWSRCRLTRGRCCGWNMGSASSLRAGRTSTTTRVHRRDLSPPSKRSTHRSGASLPSCSDRAARTSASSPCRSCRRRCLIRPPPSPWPNCARSFTSGWS